MSGESALAAKDTEHQESVLISLDIEDDKLFLLHFIIGTYFGPDLRNHHHQKLSAFQKQASTLTSDELSGSLMKRAELERVYHYILNNADPSLVVKPRVLRRYFNGKRDGSKTCLDFPLFTDLYPSNLHPESRVRNQYKLIKNITFINNPDTSCMREDCIERFKRLTRKQSFTLRSNVDVTETNGIDVVNEVDESCLKENICAGSNANVGTCSSGEESDVAAKHVFGVSEAQAGPVVGLTDIGECDDAYLFRVSLPGVKRDARDFSCEIDENGKVLVRGITTTGEKEVHRYSQVFEMQTQNLCPSGRFSVSFNLPGPVHPHEFSGSFGTDGIFEGIIMKKLHKETV